MLKEILLMSEETNNNKQTDFQNVYFVVEKSGITIWGKYCQTMRELNSRIDNYKTLLIQNERNKIKLEQHKLNISDNKLIQRKINLSKIELIDKIKVNERELKNTLKDIELFYKMAKICRNKIIEKYGEINNDVKNKLEEEFWYKKFKHLAAMDILTSGRVSSGIFENILALPMKLKKQLLLDLKSENANSLIEETINYEDEIQLTKKEINEFNIDIKPLNNIINNINNKILIKE